jgi:hypothetical protein
MTSTYVPHLSQKGQASPAEEIVFMYNWIGLPHVAHFTRIELSLSSFLSKAESIPTAENTYFVGIGGINLAPVLRATLDLAIVSRLSLWIARAGSTPLGQTKLHEPAK